MGMFSAVLDAHQELAEPPNAGADAECQETDAVCLRVPCPVSSTGAGGCPAQRRARLGDGGAGDCFAGDEETTHNMAGCAAGLGDALRAETGRRLRSNPEGWQPVAGGRGSLGDRYHRMSEPPVHALPHPGRDASERLFSQW